jgi:hypothetical protein
MDNGVATEEDENAESGKAESGKVAKWESPDSSRVLVISMIETIMKYRDEQRQ